MVTWPHCALDSVQCGHFNWSVVTVYSTYFTYNWLLFTDTTGHLLLSTELSISFLFLLELVIRLFEETTLLVNLELIWVNICRNRDGIVNLVRRL